MPVEILAALIAAFIAGLVLALYALRQRVRAAEARMELAQLGQKLKNIGTEVAGSIAQAEAERDAALAILDALPTPVWRRGADHALDYCNRAYAAAVGRDAEAVVGEATELPGKAQAEVSRTLARRALESGAISSERLHAVVAGERRLMELLEVPISTEGKDQDNDSAGASGDGAADNLGGTVGMALDRTASEELQSELKRHIAAHAEVLETLGSGIAIFGPDMRLKFFNTAYAHLWGLEEEALKDEPHLNDIHELLRERRRLPEQSDFPAYKRDQVRLFSTLIEPLEDLLHLPDGSTLRLTATPHPFGGVLMSFEDVTDRLALESSYHTLTAVQRETLDHLFEGVAVYGADGRLKLVDGAQRPQPAPGAGRWLGGRMGPGPAARRGQSLHLPGRDRFDPRGAGLAGTQRGTGDDRPAEVGVHCQRVLRIAHAPQRHRRFCRDPRKPVLRRAQRTAAGVQPGHRRVLPAPAHPDQRHSRFGHHRGGLPAPRPRRGGPDIGTQTADELRLKQALFNLLSNAVKYTPEGGRVVLSARRREDGVEVSVADTGVGIAESDQDRVFESFERGGSGRQSGAGLGLSLVKRLIELHGGRVMLQSTAGEGTHVTCVIPATPPPQDSAFPDQPTPDDAFAVQAAAPEAAAGR
jgi:PAS domain-containing protein/anti-sigma regulatory factor (Ser/Thr protein kinase)